MGEIGRGRQPPTHNIVGDIPEKLWVSTMHTVRQAPRMLTTINTLDSTTPPSYKTHLFQAGTLAWPAGTLSSVLSFEPHRVLIITPCYCNETALFNIRIVNHTEIRANLLLAPFNLKQFQFTPHPSSFHFQNIYQMRMKAICIHETIRKLLYIPV